MDSHSSENKKQASSGRRFLLFLAIIVVAAGLPIAIFGWAEFPRVMLFFEVQPPVIKISADDIRGIGLTPVTLKIELQDIGAGLDEVVIRTEQRAKRREVLREKLHGQSHTTIRYEFRGINSKLEEGYAEIEVRAFDRSFWSNASEKIINLKVDYRKPHLDVLTTQHNSQQGGSQLIFYRAFDEELELTGVKVGTKTFEGFKAAGIDPAFSDDTLYVALYAVPLVDQVEKLPIKLFAVDTVGNAVSETFYNKIKARSLTPRSVNIGEAFLRDKIASLSNRHFDQLQRIEKERTGKTIQFRSKKGTNARLVEQFKLVNGLLRHFDQEQIFSLLTQRHFLRYQRYWKGKFKKQPGSILQRFGEKITYNFQSKSIGSATGLGYEIQSVPNARALASNSGVVIFSDHLGTYGRVVAIDHGLGLVSIYGRLNNTLVREGDEVSPNDAIGIVGDSGFAQTPQLYYEMRVQGVSVDPVEWWDQSWVNSHIDGKINEVKKLLGITRYVPLT